MRPLLLILSLVALVALAACGDQNQHDQHAAAECDPANCAAARCGSAVADSIPAPAGKVYGAGVSGGSTVPMADIVADPAAYVGRTVRVQGPVARVCRHAGCWFDFGVGDDDLLRLQVVEGEIVFPPGLEGEVAMAEGVLEALPMSYAQSCAYLEQDATRRGVAFDKGAVPAEGITYYRIMGTGAVVLESPAP